MDWAADISSGMLSSGQHCPIAFNLKARPGRTGGVLVGLTTSNIRRATENQRHHHRHQTATRPAARRSESLNRIVTVSSVLLILKILYAVHDFTTDFVARC